MFCKSIKFSRESLAKVFFGNTIKESQESECCINCKQPIFRSNKNSGQFGNIYSDAGMREYQITGMCETCFDIVSNIEE